MADIIVVAVLAAAVFFIVRSQLYKLCSGRCGGGCPEGCEEGRCGGDCHGENG